MANRKCRDYCPVVLFIAALLCIVLGAVLIFVFQYVIYKQIADQVPLSEDSKSFAQWKAPSDTVPIFMQFWFWHVTNPDEVLNGSKPSLVQIGPFTFDREKSVADENATFTSVNLVPLTIASLLENLALPTLAKRAAAFAVMGVEGNKFFRSYTVKDILWGYHDRLVDDIKAALKLLPFKINLPFPDQIGLFYGKNYTDDGLYNIFTGKTDLSKFSVVNTWKNASTLSLWSSKQANMLNGTDGVTFPPFVKTTDILYVFSSDICRSIYFNFVKSLWEKGISLYRFTAPSDVFANSTANPANAGFCIPKCLGSGVLNMSTCQPGPPVVMSQPHYYQAADEYVTGVFGLNPGPELATVIDVEPHTGVALHAAKKLQINLDLHPVDGFSVLAKVKPVFLPIAWLNESNILDDNLASQFYNQVMLPLLITEIIQYSIIAVGVLGVIVMLVYFIVTKSRAPSRDKNDDQEQPIVAEVEPVAEEDGQVQGVNNDHAS